LDLTFWEKYDLIILLEKQKKGSKMTTNNELFETLVSKYADMSYACYSDWAGAIEQDKKRFYAALENQDIFTEEEISAEFTKRHNDWVNSQK
jgi:hypothetical protein